MVSALARTYAQAVAGSTLSMAFNATTNAFVLQFTANPKVAAPTIVYLNEAMHYPKGYSCIVTPTNAAKCLSDTPNTLTIFDAVSAPTNVTVTVTAV